MEEMPILLAHRQILLLDAARHEIGTHVLAEVGRLITLLVGDGRTFGRLASRSNWNWRRLRILPAVRSLSMASSVSSIGHGVVGQREDSRCPDSRSAAVPEAVFDGAKHGLSGIARLSVRRGSHRIADLAGQNHAIPASLQNFSRGFPRMRPCCMHSRCRRKLIPRSKQ